MAVFGDTMPVCAEDRVGDGLNKRWRLHTAGTRSPDC